MRDGYLPIATGKQLVYIQKKGLLCNAGYVAAVIGDQSGAVCSGMLTELVR